MSLLTLQILYLDRPCSLHLTRKFVTSLQIINATTVQAISRRRCRCFKKAETVPLAKRLMTTFFLDRCLLIIYKNVKNINEEYNATIRLRPNKEKVCFHQDYTHLNINNLRFELLSHDIVASKYAKMAR